MSYALRRDGAFKDRLSSAALALLLQAGFIAAFLYAFPMQTPPKHLEREEEIFFPPPLPKIVPHPETEPAPPMPAPPRAVTPPLFVRPPAAVMPLPDAPAAQALQNFGQALQDCTPGNYENLPPERKAHCTRPGDGVGVQNAPALMDRPARAKDEAHWAASVVDRNTPARVPCVYLEDQSLGNEKVGHNVMANPLCVLNLLNKLTGY